MKPAIYCLFNVILVKSKEKVVVLQTAKKLLIFPLKNKGSGERGNTTAIKYLKKAGVKC
jgi:hypothetical protein